LNQLEEQKAIRKYDITHHQLALLPALLVSNSNYGTATKTAEQNPARSV
jgi:hypothetical protein